MGFGTDFRTRQTPEKKSNCSNRGTVLVSVPEFILALVPSLGLEPRPGLVSVSVSVEYQFGGLVSVPVVVPIRKLNLDRYWVSRSEWVLISVYVS